MVQKLRKVSDNDRATGPPRVVPFTDPDLVGRIFDYIVEQMPELAGHRSTIERAIRDEFGKTMTYVRRRMPGEPNPLIAEVARLFNGRNASEVARVLQISRGAVYRLLKQPGRHL